MLRMSSPRGELYLWHDDLEADTYGDNPWVTGWHLHHPYGF
jgi:hypothetical protein